MIWFIILGVESPLACCGCRLISKGCVPTPPGISVRSTEGPSGLRELSVAWCRDRHPHSARAPVSPVCLLSGTCSLSSLTKTQLEIQAILRDGIRSSVTVWPRSLPFLLKEFLESWRIFLDWVYHKLLLTSDIQQWGLILEWFGGSPAKTVNMCGEF